MSAGSDIHHLNQKHYGGMSFPYKLDSIQDFVKGFMAGEGTPVFVRNIDEEGFSFKSVAEEKPLVEISQRETLPVIVH